MVTWWLLVIVVVLTSVHVLFRNNTGEVQKVCVGCRDTGVIQKSVYVLLWGKKKGVYRYDTVGYKRGVSLFETWMRYICIKGVAVFSAQLSSYNVELSCFYYNTISCKEELQNVDLIVMSSRFEHTR